MFHCDFDARIEYNGIVDVPAVGAGVAADNAPVIKVRHAKIGRAANFQSPCRKKIIFGAGSPNRSLLFAVNVNFFVPFAEPERTARADREDRADIMAFALGVEKYIVLARLDWVFLPVLRVKIRRILRQLGFLDPVNFVIEQPDLLFALVDDLNPRGFSKRHMPETIVGIPVFDDDGQAVNFAALAEG